MGARAIPPRLRWTTGGLVSGHLGADASTAAAARISSRSSCNKPSPVFSVEGIAMEEGEHIQELEILSTKRSHLSHPGTLFNDLYYSRLNSTVELVECTYSQGRFFQTLSSGLFGSTSQINIPNSSFLSDTFLHLEVPNIVANQSLCRGWGYAAIKEISYLFGSSNVPQLTITGQSIFHLLMAQSESSDKHNELFRLGGEEILAPLIAPPGQDVPLISADIKLPFPWSAFSGMCEKLPFDTNMLRNPLTINIVLNPSSAIYGGTGVRPAGFTNALVTFRLGDLTNKDLSLSTQLFRNPELMYGYPYIHAQSFASPPFTGVLRSQGVTNVVLQQFISSDLVGICLGAVRQSRLAPGGNNSPSIFAYDQLYNLTMTINGITSFFTPGTQYKLTNMNCMVGGSYVSNSVIAPGGAAPFNSAAEDTYVVFIDFSRLRSASFCRNYSNVLRYPQQTFNLTFSTETTEIYTLYATYLYNGINEVQNGESLITFS
jgi:hypothetical protein